MPVFLNNRPIKRTREILINPLTLTTNETDYKKLIFIHIPRCAGATITTYLTKRYGQPRLLGKYLGGEKPIANSTDNTMSQLTGQPSITAPSPEFNMDIPMQHYNIATLRSYRDALGVSFGPATRIVCCVRHPYDRVISDMFYLGYINPNNTPDEVYTQLVAYLKTPKNWRSALQLSYMLDEFGNVVKDIRVVKVEQLASDMQSLGYVDFPFKQNLISGEKYAKYLDADAKSLIYQAYEPDFRVFNYLP